MLSKHLHKYFWDVESRKLDIKKYKFYIIERLLEMGDDEAVKWLNKNFQKSDFNEVLQKSRRISDRSRNYWNLVLGC